MLNLQTLNERLGEIWIEVNYFPESRDGTLRKIEALRAEIKQIKQSDCPVICLAKRNRGKDNIKKWNK